MMLAFVIVLVVFLVDVLGLELVVAVVLHLKLPDLRVSRVRVLLGISSVELVVGGEPCWRAS